MFTRPAKEQVAQKEARVVAVAATRAIRSGFLLFLFLLHSTVQAAILPEDRSDLLYHSYDGGGVEISGPSLLVRKQAGKSFSFQGNYYVDSVSSASIDVITTASPYKEKRTEKTLGVDYLHDKTTMSLSYTNSDENDYTANTVNFSLSQEVFGGLTTVNMGYAKGWNTVRKRGDASFQRNNNRQNYRVGVSQVLTKNLLAGVSFETITDEGFLNNPYRSVRYVDSTSSSGYSYEAERYPNTKTSNAIAFRARYYLPYRAALHGEYRYYTDSWGINANTFEIGYTHPLKKKWILDFKLRFYQQNNADFYSDLFPYQNAQNFLARDKELSTFKSTSFGIGTTYKFKKGSLNFIDKGTINLFYDFIHFNYDDFRDLRVVTPNPGEEPLYSFNANVIQLFVSVWY